jgi:hypothetical protein
VRMPRLIVQIIPRSPPKGYAKGYISFPYQPHKKDLFEECFRCLYTPILLCDGPEQEDRVKPRCIADSWYERRLESRLYHNPAFRLNSVIPHGILILYPSSPGSSVNLPSGASCRNGYTTATFGRGPGMRPMPGRLRFMLLWSQP